jgi:DNA ligase-3
VHYKKGRSTVTLAQVNKFLDNLTGVTKEDDQLQVFDNFFPSCTPYDLRWIAKIMDKDLKINIGPKYVLEAIHPKLYQAYKHSNDLKMIIERYQDHSLELESAKKKGLTKVKSFQTSISLMTPVKPMLAK